MFKNYLKKCISLTLALFVLIGTGNINYATSIDNQKVISQIDIHDLKEEELLTYDEMIEVMVNDGISFEEAKKSLEYNPNIFKSNNITPHQLSYTTRYVTLPIKNNYEVQIAFYLTIDSAYGAYAIHEVNRVSLDRGYSGKAKQFDGELYYNLENNTTIYYELNGDFYNNGETTMSGGGAIKVNDSATLNFSVSYSSNYFAYAFKSGRLLYGNVKPR